MIQLICGPKGTGKTKVILERLNQAVETAKGDIVFITDKRFNTVKVDFKVRCIYAEEFGVQTVEAFTGFIKGLLAGNADIEYLYIDGVCRIIGADGQAVEFLLTVLKQLEAEYGFNAVLTMSVLPEELPESAQQYVG